MNIKKLLILVVLVICVFLVLFLNDNGNMSVHNEKDQLISDQRKEEDQYDDNDDSLVIEDNNDEIADTEVNFEEEKQDNQNDKTDNNKQNNKDEQNNHEEKNDSETNETEKDDDSNLKDDQNQVTLSYKYESEVCAGHYTAGKDIPSGFYDIDVVSGSGNVYSSNLENGINVMMSIKATSTVFSSYSKVELNEGDILSLSGNLVLNLTSDQSSETFTASREAVEKDDFILKTGEYVAGTDFEAGVYNIVGTKYSGTVYSSNFTNYGINELMGSAGSSCVKEVKNVYLPEGTILKIDGTSVRLIPVK